MTVIFCGENPELRLLQSGDHFALASYWRCTYSPHGVGQLLVLHAGDLTTIHADNAPLARFIIDTLVQHFPGLNVLNLPQVAIETAQLTQHGTAQTGYHVRSVSDRHTVEAVWSDIREVRPLATLSAFINEGDTVLDVSNVICTAAQGSITVNGVAISGQIESYHDDDHFRSSAFLAFSETWSRHDLG